MSGCIHSHPEPHAARRLQVRYPCDNWLQSVAAFTLRSDFKTFKCFLIVGVINCSGVCEKRGFDEILVREVVCVLVRLLRVAS